MCPSEGEYILLSPVGKKPQCCLCESCKEQALAFATRIVHHATLVREAEYRRCHNILGGWQGNKRRKRGGQPGLGGDGYLCWEWEEQVELAFHDSLVSYYDSHQLCFRGASVSKGGGLSRFWNAYHNWFLVYGPRNTSPSYRGGGDTVVVDPWPSAGLEMVPSDPYDAERFEPGYQVFWGPGL